MMFSAAGCHTPPSTVPRGPLRASDSPSHEAIPVPAGYRLIDRGSEHWSSGSIRFIRHRYEVPADPARIHRFYAAQMPLVRWAPVSDRMADGRYTMRFQRTREECTILFGPKMRNGRTLVEAIVTPKAETRTPTRE